MNAHDPLLPTGRRGKDVPGGVGMGAASGHQTAPGLARAVPDAVAAKVLADPPFHGGTDLRTISLSNTRHHTGQIRSKMQQQVHRFGILHKG